MDGMTEACVKGGIEACFASVSCACALLVALDELSQGRGIQPEQVVPLKGQFTLRQEKKGFSETVDVAAMFFRRGFSSDDWTI